MKTYLVTGAAGFIGANYIKYILAKHNDIKVVILDALTYAGNLGTIANDIDDERCFFVKGDICDRVLADELFAKYKFDYVVNFAAESHVDRSIENPQLFLMTNILGTQNLLDAARRAWVTGKDESGYPTWRKGVRYHQVSTDEVYGSLGAEGYFTEQTPLCPHSPYSASKTSADMVVMAYHDTYKMPVTITRCSNNYGPYHFPEKLIPLIIKNILEGKNLPVYGDGSNVRDWLYVEDHCKAIDLVVREGAKVRGLNPTTICSTHGPVWQRQIPQVMDIYDRLSRYEGEPGVVLAYGSMYGNTEQMAERIARELASRGVGPIVMYNLSFADESVVLRDVFRYDTLIVGAPTYNGGIYPPAARLLDLIAARCVPQRNFGWFGSFCWAGAAVRGMGEFAQRMKWEPICDPVEMKQGFSSGCHDFCSRFADGVAERFRR